MNYGRTTVAKILQSTPPERYSLSNYVVLKRIDTIILKLQAILSLLCFKQGFLGNHAMYQVEVFNMYS